MRYKGYVWHVVTQQTLDILAQPLTHPLRRSIDHARIRSAFDKLFPRDIGKWIMSQDGVLQIESDEQMAERLKWQ